VVLKFHREALSDCAAAAKAASGALKGLAVTAPDQAAFAQVDGSARLATAAAALAQAATQASKELGGRMEAVEGALHAVERTFTAADDGAVRG
jgi:hypothetical protein